jgi:CheY-like chemotaxis protein
VGKHSMVSAAKSGHSGRPLHVLLVEDDTVDVMNVQRAFTRAGITSSLQVAGDGSAALTMLRDGRVPAARSIVLLDLNMPQMGGREFLHTLRADPALASTPVVVLTTSDDAGDLAVAWEHQVAGYLLKPMDFEQFVEMIATFDRYWNMMTLA